MTHVILQRIRARFLLYAMLFAGVVGLGAVTEQTPTPSVTAPIASATVADLKGNVQVQLPGQSVSAPSLGQVLPAETVITTGNGRVLLRLEDGSEILVYSNTRLTLKQPSPTSWQHLQVLLGKIKAEIQKRVGGAAPFQVGTPSAVITVRGTRFYVEVDKHQVTRVTVEQGVVEVQSTKGNGKPVEVKGGFSVRVKENSEPDPVQSTPPGQSGNRGNDHGNGPGLNQHGSPAGGHGKRP